VRHLRGSGGLRHARSRAAEAGPGAERAGMDQPAAGQVRRGRDDHRRAATRSVGARRRERSALTIGTISGTLQRPPDNGGQPSVI
jgi:hypothetical protein